MPSLALATCWVRACNVLLQSVLAIGVLRRGRWCRCRRRHCRRCRCVWDDGAALQCRLPLQHLTHACRRAPAVPATVVDNLPQVGPEKYDKLTAILAKIFSGTGRIREGGLVHPVDEASKTSKGFAFVEYENVEQAKAAQVRWVAGGDKGGGGGWIRPELDW